MTSGEPYPEGDGLFANAFEYSAVGMALVAPDGKWLKVNPALCAILGYAEGELLGGRFQDVTHEEDLAEDLRLVKELLAGERVSYQMEKRYRHKPGAVVWAVLSVSLVRDGEGRPLHFISQIQDVTELKRAEERRDSFFKLSLDMMAITGLDGYFREVNPAWTRVLGWTEEELKARPVFDLLHPDDLEATQQARERLAEGVPLLELENRYRCKDGRYRWFSWRSVARPEEGTVFAVARDITERKQTEEALRRASAAAEAASKAKSDYLATMSHEIRTPMNAVVGFADLLSDTELNGPQADYVACIQKSGESLLEIINGILDYSKMEAGMYQLTVEPMDVGAVVQEVHEMLQPLAQERGLALTVAVAAGLPERLEGDASALRRVLINLAGNAIKFTEWGGVEIDARPGVENGRAVVRVRVRDTGMGLNEKIVDRLFVPFEQGDPADRRRYGGSGLGLAISHRLVEYMGGTLAAQNREDGPGADFVFTFPMVRSNGEARTVEPEAATMPVVAPGLKILLVEDNLLNQKLLVLMLKRLGCECDCAMNGQEAVDAVARERYDVVLMDVQMPVMDGWQATREIRRREAMEPKKRRHYIIGQTAYASADDAERSREAGMDAQLTKPISLVSLAGALAKAS